MKQTLPFQLSCALLALLAFVYLQIDVFAPAEAQLATPILARFPPEWLPWLGFLALLPAGAGPTRFAVAAGSVVAALLIGPALAIAFAAWRFDEHGTALANNVAAIEYGRYLLAFVGPAAVALVVGVVFQWRRQRRQSKRGPIR